MSISNEQLQQERELLEKYREYAARILKGAPHSNYRDELVERIKKIDAAIASIDEALGGVDSRDSLLGANQIQGTAI